MTNPMRIEYMNLCARIEKKSAARRAIFALAGNKKALADSMRT